MDTINKCFANVPMRQKHRMHRRKCHRCAMHSITACCILAHGWQRYAMPLLVNISQHFSVMMRWNPYVYVGGGWRKMSGLLCDKDKITSAITVACRPLLRSCPKDIKCSKATIRTKLQHQQDINVLKKHTAFANNYTFKKRENHN